MTAKEKFEKRLNELNLMEKWNSLGAGRIGTTLDDGTIVVLIHESNEDGFTEIHYPSFEELRKNEKFVRECKNEFYPNWDADEVKKLALWLEFGDKIAENPMYPEDVYFPANGLETEYFDFKDDVEPEDNKEDEMYRDFLSENRGKITLIDKQLTLIRTELIEMIRGELKRGHNLNDHFDPYPGWDSSCLCAYVINEWKDVKVKDDSDGIRLTFKSCYGDDYDLCLTSPDFPIAVLSEIYSQMG